MYAIDTDGLFLHIFSYFYENLNLFKKSLPPTSNHHHHHHYKKNSNKSLIMHRDQPILGAATSSIARSRIESQVALSIKPAL